ncbi:MAG: hypothetical protein ABIP42_11070, partial [Planctomycetota bacterium]
TELMDQLGGAQARETWARWGSGGTRRMQLTPAFPLELELETPLDGLEPALDLVTAAVERAASPSGTQTSQSALEFLRAMPRWERAAALGIPVSSPGKPAWHWHAAALARTEDGESVRAALAHLEARSRALPPSHASQAVARMQPPLVSVIDADSSLQSELRWTPSAELAPDATPQDRASSSVRAAALPRLIAVWKYVPACVDRWGRREPGYLYAAGDIVSSRRNLEALRAALENSIPAEAIASARAERVAFARAQLSQDSFRLHAMHGSGVGSFEQDLIALESLSADALAAPIAANSARWSAVGPAAIWREQLAALGSVESIASPAPHQDGGAESQLARLWSALGGSERWRDLKTLRLLGRVEQIAEGTRQGTEQWIDFEHDRFALSQIVSTQETLVVATPSEIWAVDQASGVDLTPSQARKLRSRQERSLFTNLRRLAQPDHGGLTVLAADQRLILISDARELCWIELDDKGLPQRLGYALDGSSEASLYEFSDWKLDARLPYPERTLQVDRGASVIMQFVDADATLDPALWQRGKR